MKQIVPHSGHCVRPEMTQMRQLQRSALVQVATAREWESALEEDLGREDGNGAARPRFSRVRTGREARLTSGPCRRRKASASPGRWRGRAGS